MIDFGSMRISLIAENFRETAGADELIFLFIVDIHFDFGSAGAADTASFTGPTAFAVREFSFFIKIQSFNFEAEVSRVFHIGFDSNGGDFVFRASVFKTDDIAAVALVGS